VVGVRRSTRTQSRSQLQNSNVINPDRSRSTIPRSQRAQNRNNRSNSRRGRPSNST
jgi:hypothetical protein